jgi:hypothetical protein
MHILAQCASSAGAAAAKIVLQLPSSLVLTYDAMFSRHQQQKPCHLKHLSSKVEWAAPALPMDFHAIHTPSQQ